MVSTAPRVQQIAIKVNGTDVPVKLMDDLFEVEVETTLHLPSMFILRFYDDELEWVDSGPFAVGAPVQIDIQEVLTDTMKPVFKGEITAVEPEFTEGYTAMLTVRGYDRGHRLNRGSNTKVFVNVKDSDIVSQIGGAAGLSVQVDQTSQVHDHVFQDNQNDLAFLHFLASRNGYELLVDDKKLHFRKPKSSGEVELTWGTTLRSFRPRMSLAKQVNEVIVKGWDPQQKKEIIGKAASSQTAPEINVGGWGGAVAQSKFSAAKRYEVRRPVASQKEADDLAQAILDQINMEFVQAEGVAFGDPDLAAGKKVMISKVGSRFSGKYTLTAVRHIYTKEGYDTYFAVEGTHPHQMADLMGGKTSEDHLWGGVVPAIVTNNNDEKKMGRVKVKFPWLDDQLESDWARIAAIGAGNGRGMLWIPEVNDEVLVAFEHGDFNHPYVIGNLWNGKDKVPQDDAIQNGKVEIRTIKTRDGHIIRMTDGSEKSIEIIDAENNTSIKFDTKEKKITIISKGDLSIDATGNVTLKGKNVTVEAETALTLKGSNGKLETSGPLTVKGSIVNIN